MIFARASMWFTNICALGVGIKFKQMLHWKFADGTRARGLHICDSAHICVTDRGAKNCCLGNNRQGMSRVATSSFTSSHNNDYGEENNARTWQGQSTHRSILIFFSFNIASSCLRPGVTRMYVYILCIYRINGKKSHHCTLHKYIAHRYRFSLDLRQVLPI